MNCGKKYEARDFVTHVRAVHSQEGQGFSCPICGLLGAVYAVGPQTNLIQHLQHGHPDIWSSSSEAFVPKNIPPVIHSHSTKSQSVPIPKRPSHSPPVPGEREEKNKLPKERAHGDPSASSGVKRTQRRSTGDRGEKRERDRKEKKDHKEQNDSKGNDELEGREKKEVQKGQKEPKEESETKEKIEGELKKERRRSKSSRKSESKDEKGEGKRSKGENAEHKEHTEPKKSKHHKPAEKETEKGTPSRRSSTRSKKTDRSSEKKLTPHVEEKEKEKNIQAGPLMTTPTVSSSGDYLISTCLHQLEEECGICYDEFMEGAVVARLGCFCLYHKQCIEMWFSKKGKNSCPLHFDDETPK
eukprot:TRINITY_DN2979_c0_g1_i1.p1 TRINITY_DN2979_c0_g1~~TRINITY_DN2979_c0_g1_i1.p1  ORF type:complete len:356 (+),score=72.75 TRINITY_DN2979_c0_g1_i1:398-1465(+)